jgi:membrane protein DedA with SNARE-associated domain
VDWVTDAVRSGGLWALLFVMLAENLFPPIPSEAVLPLAGYLVYRGDLGYLPVVIVATAGSTLGAVILYLLGRYGGRPLLLRYGRVLRMSEADLDRADGWFDRHGGKIVFFGRMVPLARSIVSVPAGTSQMSIGRFLMLTLIGSLLWNLLLVSLGYLFGEQWERIAEVVSRFSTPIAILVAIALVGAAVWWFWGRGRQASRRP